MLPWHTLKYAILLVAFGSISGPTLGWAAASCCEDAAFTFGRTLAIALADSASDPAAASEELAQPFAMGEHITGPVASPFLLADAAPRGAKADKRRGNRKSRKAGKATPAPKGIGVDAATVLRLANAGARPQAVPAVADGIRPAGLRLVGVSALGVGVRDGDVLTSVAGMPATDEGAVVAAVLHARAHHAPSVSARFWRDGEEWHLVVGMPYPRSEKKRAESTQATARR